MEMATDDPQIIEYATALMQGGFGTSNSKFVNFLRGLNNAVRRQLCRPVMGFIGSLKLARILGGLLHYQGNRLLRMFLLSVDSHDHILIG